MFDDRSEKYKNQYVPLEPINVDLHEPFIGKEDLDEIKFSTDDLKKHIEVIWAGLEKRSRG